MVIGLSIRIPNETNRYLYDILKDTDICNFVCSISYDEVLYTEDGINKTSLFSSDVVDGTEMMERIKFNKYYLIFIDIKAFPTKDDIVEVENYNDYLNSYCNTIVLCTDSQYIDIYSKKEELLETVTNNCIRCNFPYHVITEKNNLRTKMSVY